MPTNQKYTPRLHSKRQLASAEKHLSSIHNILLHVGARYQDALPRVSQGCAEMIVMVEMLVSMVNDLRENI